MPPASSNLEKNYIDPDGLGIHPAPVESSGTVDSAPDSADHMEAVASFQVENEPIGMEASSSSGILLNCKTPRNKAEPHGEPPGGPSSSSSRDLPRCHFGIKAVLKIAVLLLATQVFQL